MRGYAIAILLLVLAGRMPGQQSNAAIDKDSRLVVELEHALDIKKLKVGDKFTARLMDHVKSEGKIIVPYTKGKIIGHVAEVQAPSKDNTQSRLVLAFDKITIKGGGELPVTALIAAVAPYEHLPLSGSSVPTSGDNPVARAAGPRTDSNGNAVIPAHAPTSRPGPVEIRQSSGMEGVELTQDHAAQTTEIIAAKKPLRIDEWSKFILVVNSPQQP